jgi:hypothetical protein
MSQEITLLNQDAHGILAFDTIEEFLVASETGVKYSKIIAQDNALTITDGATGDSRASLYEEVVILGVSTGSARRWFAGTFADKKSAPACITAPSYDRDAAPHALSSKPQASKCSQCPQNKKFNPNVDQSTQCKAYTYLAVALLSDLKQGIVQIYSVQVSPKGLAGNPIPSQNKPRGVFKDDRRALQREGFIGFSKKLDSFKVPGKTTMKLPQWAFIAGLTAHEKGHHFQLIDLLMTVTHQAEFNLVKDQVRIDPEVFNLTNLFTDGAYALDPNRITEEVEEEVFEDDIPDFENDVPFAFADKPLQPTPTKVESKPSAVVQTTADDFLD